jgi:hypothetical protein
MQRPPEKQPIKADLDTPASHDCIKSKKEKVVAENGFDPLPSGL